MKIAFMGTPEFAVSTLKRLIESRHEVALVVTQPSKPKGRGRKIADPPVKTLADSGGIEVMQPANLIREPIDDKIRALGIDVIVVAAYGKILRPALLRAPRLGCLNVHGSLLPEYRGAAPVQRALMDGRHETGVTIMEMVAEMDAGPILAQKSVEIEEDDDALSLANMLSVIGADLIIRVLDDVERDDRIKGEPQEESRVTYAPKIKSEEGELDWREQSEKILYRLRGLSPRPGLYTTIGAKRVRMIDLEPLDTGEAGNVGARADADPGSVTGFVSGFGFTVRTGDGHVLVKRLQPPGKKPMDAEPFLNGNPLRVGAPLAKKENQQAGVDFYGEVVDEKDVEN